MQNFELDMKYSNHAYRLACKYVKYAHKLLTQDKPISEKQLTKLHKKWHVAFSTICRYLGITGDYNIAYLFFNMGSWFNNWDHLYETEDEEKRTPKEWLEITSFDVLYCSDRFSFERLLRCQWQHSHTMRAFAHALAESSGGQEWEILNRFDDAFDESH